MTKCEICKYQKYCPDIVEENSVYCLTHRKIPKNFNNEYIEKQKLISFLEDKIKGATDKEKRCNSDADMLISNYLIGKINAYQEILDFVNKGGKNE